MKDAPPDRDDEDIDEEYRRASSLDASRPGERVRSAVLAHAARLAHERSTAARSPVGASREGRRPRFWLTRGWTPLVSSLAVAGLAALLITPHYLPLAPRKEAVTAMRQGPASAPRLEAPPAPTPPPPAALAQAPAQVPAESPAVPAESPAAAAPAPFPERRSARSVMRPEGPQSWPQVAQAPRAYAPPGPSVAPGDSSASDRAAAAPGASSNLAEASAAREGAVTGAARSAARSASSALQTGMDPNIRLQRAAASGDLEGLEGALGEHADLEARDARGRTALMLATLRGERRAVDYLLAHGADPDARDASGVSPLEAARAAHREEIAAALMQAGAH
jgi:hypothetical protein